MTTTAKKLTALATAATFALGTAGAAQARHGADDPAGHVRHSGTDDSRRTTRVRRARKQSDDGPGHIRHSRGADDGPNHT